MIEIPYAEFAARYCPLVQPGRDRRYDGCLLDPVKSLQDRRIIQAYRDAFPGHVWTVYTDLDNQPEGVISGYMPHDALGYIVTRNSCEDDVVMARLKSLPETMEV
jgi:hypothetical protein